MMKLADAAAYFDRTPALNPDNGIRLFTGQLDPFDDSRRDAGAAYRRVLSVKPGTRLPASRAVRIFGQVWIIGAMEVDGLAAPLREKYVAQRADQKVSVYRLPDFLSNTLAASYWAGVEWLKDVKQIEVDSRTPQTCSVFMQQGANVQERDVIAYEGVALLVIAKHDQPSGYTVATALRLDQSAPGTATITARTYIPGTGFTSSAPITTPCLRVRWQDLFEYGSQADERFQEGDCSLVLPAATSLTTRDRIAYDGITWSVISTDTLAGALVAHVRRS